MAQALHHARVAQVLMPCLQQENSRVDAPRSSSPRNVRQSYGPRLWQRWSSAAGLARNRRICTPLTAAVAAGTAPLLKKQHGRIACNAYREAEEPRLERDFVADTEQSVVPIGGLVCCLEG